MSAKPTPPCIRALDADGSEFFMDARGLAWRADSSRVPELDGPAAAPDAVRCRYSDCRHPEANEAERVTCPDCRADLGLPPLDRAEVVRVLATEYRANGLLLSAIKCKITANRLEARCDAYEEVADSLGLRAEFDAACKEVPHA